MVAAEAMGYSTGRKIFKHLVPNVMPQLIVQMTLSLGSMILYEATLSYLNLGVKAPYAAWGTMINIISTNQDVLQNHWHVWVPAGICIVIAVFESIRCIGQKKNFFLTIPLCAASMIMPLYTR